MARIAGVNIPNHQHTVIALTAIYGIGRPRAKAICVAANVLPSAKVKDLSDADRKRAKASGLIIRAEVAGTLPHAVVNLGGDPRGSCVKIQRTPEDRGDSWGEDGWCVPASGYSASQMARMTGRS